MSAGASAYQLAQKALADLKTSIFLVLSNEERGMTNSEIGRALGIYYGHSGKHEGHIPRVLLGIMESEGVVVQEESTKRWRLKSK